MKVLALKYLGFGNESLNSFAPDHPKNFCLWLDLSIGFLDEDGGDFFQVGICTPTWLAHQVSIRQVVVPRNLLIVEEFCFDVVKKKIEEIIMQSARDSGAESMAALSRYFSWEFDI